MNRGLRTLTIALLLGALASVVGIVMLLVPVDQIPLFHRVTDLATHVSALSYAKQLGLPAPAYDVQPNNNIGIITIDDITLKSGKVPVWPFPRSTYGTLLNTLKAAGARAVVFDIDFLDPSADPSQDARFAAAMRSMPTVLAYAVNTTSTGQLGEQLPPPQLARAAAALGYSTVDTPGGYLIGQPPEVDTGAGKENGNERLFSLSAAAAQTYLGHPIDFAALPSLDRSLLLLPPDIQYHQDIQTQSQVAQMLFPGRGVLSFSDAYTTSPAELRPFAQGALIYVGATATGLGDFYTTARGRIPGLFINARFADQLMRGFYMTPAPLWLDVLLIVLLPLLVALLFTHARPAVAIAVSLLATVVYAYVNVAIFITRTYWIDLVHVVLAMLLATMFVAAYRVLKEGAERRMVTNLFGMHVSPAVVHDILQNEDPRSGLALKGKRVRATIFYSDIRGFTAMSETMTPEEIYAQLNEYFEEMCAIIFQYGGYVDKFIGDCVMAVFSAPYQTPDDAGNAVRAAVAQQKKILELAEKWKALGKREFTVGMGVNTGDVVMGNLGSSSRMNYTVIGDNVNVAARLYNVAKGGEIIISDSTYEECKDFVIAQEFEPVAVKGKVEPIRIYNILDIKPEP